MQILNSEIILAADDCRSTMLLTVSANGANGDFEVMLECDFRPNIQFSVLKNIETIKMNECANIEETLPQSFNDAS